MGRCSPAEARCRRSGRGWRHRGSGSRSRGDDATRTAASSVAPARGRQALKRRGWPGFRSGLGKWQPPGPAITASLVVYGSALLGTVLLGGQGWKLAVPLALGWTTSVAAHRVLRDFTVAGRLVGVIKWWLIAVDDQGAVDVGRRHLTDRLRRLGLYVLQDRDRYVMR